MSRTHDTVSITMVGGVRLIRPEDRTPGPFTPGMEREEAWADRSVWAGFLRTAPRTASGWHHHGDNQSVIYVLTGALVMEFGPGGDKVLEAGPGDFLIVNERAVHRESNPSHQESTAVVVRAGTGPSLFNVDGPESDGAARP